jgi:hypothetical protein
MLSKLNVMTEQEQILQHFVHIGRRILCSRLKNEGIPSSFVSELKMLVEKADQMGIHGIASSDLNEIVVSFDNPN